MPKRTTQVDHPDYYGGGDNPYEVIKVLEAWGLNENARLWNAVKYIARRGEKSREGDKIDLEVMIQDLMKARWYLDREIAILEGAVVDA